MIKISAVIITYNEEEHLEKCLSSLVNVVDEIVVVDSFSTDKTPKICKKHNVKFIQQNFLGDISNRKTLRFQMQLMNIFFLWMETKHFLMN